MIALEEKTFQSIKTDASLYNGQPTTNRVKKPSSLGLCRGAKEEGNSQPTDTGSMCHSIGVTSNTPSIPKIKDGVSVENAHTHSKQWFRLRVSYGRIFKAKDIIAARNVEVMDNFINLTSVNNPHIIPVTSQNIQYKLGDHVIVTEGNFEGIQGRVARIAGQQRVIVELCCGCLVATAYIPRNAIKPFV